MKILIAVTYVLFALHTLPSHAEESSEPVAVPVQEPHEDTKEFNKDLDDFEKNISKEAPPPVKAKKASTSALKPVEKGAKKPKKPSKAKVANKKTKPKKAATENP